jgi:hypothetical protein
MYHTMAAPPSVWSPHDNGILHAPMTNNTAQMDQHGVPDYLSASIFQSGELGVSSPIPASAGGTDVSGMMAHSNDMLRLSHSGFFADQGQPAQQVAASASPATSTNGLAFSWDTPMVASLSGSMFADTPRITHSTHDLQHSMPSNSSYPPNSQQQQQQQEQLDMMQHQHHLHHHASPASPHLQYSGMIGEYDPVRLNSPSTSDYQQVRLFVHKSPPLLPLTQDPYV